jgi:hypothetical protein
VRAACANRHHPRHSWTFWYPFTCTPNPAHASILCKAACAAACPTLWHVHLPSL